MRSDMPASQPAPEPIEDAADSADAWERALLDRQLARLDRLAEIGMAIAGAVERRVTPPSTSPAWRGRCA
jgi:hypothetical protein